MTEFELRVLARLAAVEQTATFAIRMFLAMANVKAGDATANDAVEAMAASVQRYGYVNRSPEETAQINDAAEERVRQLWAEILSMPPVDGLPGGDQQK